MKAPADYGQGLGRDRQPETSYVRSILLGAIELFQKRVSPIDGPRCGFAPTCSAFGRQAVREQGAVLGVIMTADRLMRCNIFKKPDPGAPLLADGSILDPPAGNLLGE